MIIVICNKIANIDYTHIHYLLGNAADSAFNHERGIIVPI